MRIGLLAISSIFFVACESSMTLNLSLETEAIVLSDSFSQIQVSDDLLLAILPDTPKAILKTTYEGYTNSIQARVSGSTLFLEGTPYLLPNAIQQVRMNSYSPERIQSNDNAQVRGYMISSGQLYLNHNSKEAMDLFVLNYATEAYVNSSGFFKLVGSADILSLIVNGSAEVNTLLYEAGAVKVVHNGPTDIYIHASDFLTVEINGSGNVYYSGNPIIDPYLNGSGQLIPYFP